MAKQLVVFYSFSCAIIGASSLILPNYIKQCDRKGSNFAKCALEHANLAFPHLAKGDNQLQVPSLTPLMLPFVQVVDNNFRINFTNLKISGLETAKITFIEFLDEKLSLTFHIDRLELFGPYAAVGKVLVDLKGAGNGNITAVGGDYSVVTKLGTEVKNGETFFTFGDCELDLKFTRVLFFFENLLSSESLGLGFDINKILNDNWQDVYSDLGKAIRDTVAVIYKQVVSSIFEKIPKKYILA